MFPEWLSNLAIIWVITINHIGYYYLFRYDVFQATTNENNAFVLAN